MTRTTQLQASAPKSDAQTSASAARGPEGAMEKVALAITAGIRSGAFVPGQHLLEPDLTRRLGISRGSLREAFKHLEAEGIVTISRYRGAYIGMLSRKSTFDLLDTLEPLARMAARLAAANPAAEEEKRAIGQVAQMIETAGRNGNRAQYLDLRRKFYDLMVGMSCNLELARVIPLSRTDLFRAQTESAQSEAHRLSHAEGYAKVAAGIVAGDAAQADGALRRHFEATRKIVRDLPETAFPPGEG